MHRSRERWRREQVQDHAYGKIEVVCQVLEGVDVITIAATGSGKSLCYWMVQLYVRYGIVFGIVVGFEGGKDL